MSDSSKKHITPHSILSLSFDRRAFIEKLLVSTSSMMLYGCGGGSESTNTAQGVIPTPPTLDVPGQVLQPDRPIQTIVIIGAGMSGLVAGYELSIVGHEVIFLEARERVGGRVNTISMPFTDSQFVEAGASRIPSNHRLTLDYAAHLGLSLDTFYATTNDYFELSNNQVQRISAADYISQPPWPGSVNRNLYRKISGGMSGLPNALKDLLLSNINFSTAVTEVLQDNTSVTVTTSAGDIFIADRVLCTTPLPVLGNIQFEPALSNEKQLASSGGYHYTDSSRLYTQFSERFWQNTGFNGWGNSEYEEVWQPTWNQPGNSGILQSYLRGVPAEVFDSLTLTEQISSVHNRWRDVFPDLDDYILNNSVHSWTKERWTGSGYASPTEAQESSLKAALSTIEGRVHFAGEHASDYPGWIQGALESGIRAAKEIHQSL